MKPVFFALVFGAAVFAPAQSLHFVGNGEVPFQEVARTFGGKILESRIDVLRSKRDWDEYYSAQNGFFGGPVVTSLIQPDFCKEQVVAVNFGSTGTLGIMPSVRSVRSIGEETWEVVVDAKKGIENPSDSRNIISPYVAVRTPYGPNNYRFVFLTNEGEDVIELRSSRSYCFPRDYWCAPRDFRGHAGRIDR